MKLLSRSMLLLELWFILIILSLFAVVRVTPANILVVGSANVDTFLPVARMPVEGENLTLLPDTQPIIDVPGGKGCTQAIAAAKLVQNGVLVHFLGQFGNDSAATILEQALQSAKVDFSRCNFHEQLSSGRGYVFLTASGQVSAVVSGGSNVEGWSAYRELWETVQQVEADDENADITLIKHPICDVLNNLLSDCKCVMLQQEVPDFVNMLVAKFAKRQSILVVQDVGGEDRPIDSLHLRYCDYLVPNETELKRLVQSLGGNVSDDVVSMARFLQEKCGAQNVLVTEGSRGCTLVPVNNNNNNSSDKDNNSKTIHQSAFTVPFVIDETGAGDSFRAAFVVALLEGKTPQDALVFASAAGACAVQHFGAVPSTPLRQNVEHLLQVNQAEMSVLHIPRGDGLRGGGGGGSFAINDDDQVSSNSIKSDGADFPFLIGSRLNSMKDRPELWHQPLKNACDYLQRQATIKGLTCVDFNYPQHFDGCWTAQEAKEAIEKAGLRAGAVCLRYPAKFARGAMNHPDLEMRQEAIELTKQAARAAIELGCNEVVVWSAFDGYDYPFQVNYDDKWDELVHAFRECCDTFPDIKFSIEYKPTDENTRFFTVPSTGAALLLVQEVDRPNVGLTLDVGHMLMSGENPGKSIAMAGRTGRLFGVQLNDGYTRLAAEDGLMFGSIHPSMALEIMYQLRKTNFKGHMYFDTFPQRSDPVKEAEYNIKRVKSFWHASGRIGKERLDSILAEHDAISALELVDEVLKDAL